MLAKIEIYGNTANFRNYTYYGDNYRTVIYLDLEFNRPTTEVTQEIDQDELGNNNLIFESYIQKNSFNYLAISSILHVFQSANLNDVALISFLETGDNFIIKNVIISDAPVDDNLLGLITIEVESQASSKDNCDNDITIVPC